MGTVRVLAALACLVGCGGGGNTGDVPPGTPVVSFTDSTSSYDETDGELDVYVSIDPPVEDFIQFSIDVGGSARPGDDYTGSGAGLVVLPPGGNLWWVTINLLDDGVPEAAETIELSLSGCAGCQIGADHHTLTIRDNLLPRVTFETAISGEYENVASSTNLLVMPASPVPITVDYTLAGTATSADYALQSGTITIPAGVTSMPFAFDTLDDAFDEDDETISVTLSNPVGAILGITPAHVHTIQDNDASPIVGFPVLKQTVSEGDSGMQVLTAEVTLSEASGRTVSVSFGGSTSPFFTATLGVDYTILTPSPLVFPPGTTSKTISFAVLGDTVQDGSDVAGIELLTSGQALIGGVGVSTTHSVQIDNDDCYATGTWRICPDTIPTTDLTLDSTTYVNTNFDGGQCASRQLPGWIEAGQPSACFIVARNINIGTARFEGSRPVVFVALDSITITTLLDVASHFSGFVGIGGPGYNPSVCGTPATLNAGAGGAGGSFMTSGGNGGGHGPSAPGGTAAAAVAAPAVLRGGCTAQQTTYNEGGEGGGAVYLMAASTISIAPGAAINASGAGGAAGRYGNGAMGGGSGGMITLWAPSIVASQATLLANGGGGAEGGDGTTQQTNDGAQPLVTAPLVAAAGGTGTSGGDGGAGAAQGIAAVTGSNASGGNGAGGGGGGLGYILVHPSLTNATTSPSAATF